MAKRVLLIDYESHSVERVRGVLREPDYDVVAAHDGEEALATFSSSRFDLVLLSGMLPRLPSAEVIREIRRRGGPTAPPILLMVSGYKGSNAKADAQRVGAFDLLPRPFSDDALREAAAGAIAATAATRKSEAPSAGGGSLTASDIFSDILEEVTRETATPPTPARTAAATEAEVERRLRDTLSGILPGAAPPSKPAPKPPQSDDIDRLISRTLSGIRTEPKARPAPAPARAEKPAEPAPAPPPAAPPPEPPPADRFGQYEILERIASGGMAELFRARLSGAEGFRKIVAIKKILPHLSGDEEFLTMFADEAKLAAQLSHPNIVHIFDLGRIDSGGYFIAMEHVEGRDLRSILHMVRETGLKVPVPLAVSIAAKVASALDYAHRRRGDDGESLHIVHRDVSPPNILVSTNGDVKLCDFGIAKAASKVSRTESGALKGKLPYMSPEQAWARPVDQRSDIYSLGSVLFEMLTGRKLFSGDSELGVLEKVRAGEVVPPSTENSDVSPALDALVLKALAREPDGRYVTASEMLRDLEAVLRSYEPAPSSSDLAVYVRHLEAEDSARREARAREAAAPPPPPPAPVPEGAVPPPSPPPPAAAAPARTERPRREVRVPLREEPAAAKPAKPPPAAAAPPVTAGQPGIFASTFPESSSEAESKKRGRLYALIAAAALVLAVGTFFVVRKPAPSAAPLPAPTAPPPSPVEVTPAPTAAPAADQKAIQEEAQRQIAIRRREMQKAAGAAAAAPTRAPAGHSASAASAPATAPPAPEPSPEIRAAEAAPTRPEPTAVSPPAEPAVSAPAAPPRAEEDAVSRGDLVGPGPGVVEPVLLSSPHVSYPPAARAQNARGRVIVLVLVDETGGVSSARLQQGVALKAVNDAVVKSVREAKFRNATKNGIPVKMWRTVVVDVRP
jgi:TonB family protein